MCHKGGGDIFLKRMLGRTTERASTFLRKKEDTKTFFEENNDEAKAFCEDDNDGPFLSDFTFRHYFH